MPSYPLALDRASIVLLGRFNPSIFHPAWFARFGLLRDAEADQAKDLIATDQLSKFQADWIGIQVTPDRFYAFSDDPAASNPLRDLVASAFSVLEHTHFWALGLNRQMHYRVETEEQWHRFGHSLVPKGEWEPHMINPGLRTLRIEGRRHGAPEARIQYAVEPSVPYHPGVYFSVNEHYGGTKASDDKVAEASKPEGRRKLLGILTKEWEVSRDYAKTVAEALMSKGI